MDLIKESDFRKEIKSAPRTGYLFFGEEDYLKSFAVRNARETLCPDPTFSFFNEMKLDAVDFTPDKLLDALMPMPMMADKKLVLLNGLNFNTMRANEIDDLCNVLAALPEYDYNVLIVNVAADCLDLGYFPKKPSSTYTKLAEHLVPVQFERCSSAKLAAWVQKHFAHHGVEASPALCNTITDYCGHSMYTLAAEIEKLSYYTLAHGRQTATEADMLGKQLDMLDAKKYFDDVYGLDNIHAVSKKKRAQEWCTENPNAKPLFLGDTDHDFEVAKATGNDCVLFSGGHQSKEHLLTLGCPVIDDIRCVTDYLV